MSAGRSFGEDGAAAVFPTPVFFLLWLEGRQKAKQKEIVTIRAKAICAEKLKGRNDDAGLFGYCCDCRCVCPYGPAYCFDKTKNPLWGAVVPVLIAAAGIYFWFFRNIALSYKNIMVFAIPLAWCLIECYRGRKRRLAEAEKEIRKNEGSGYPAIKNRRESCHSAFPPVLPGNEGRFGSAGAPCFQKRGLTAICPAATRRTAPPRRPPAPQAAARRPGKTKAPPPQGPP